MLARFCACSGEKAVLPRSFIKVKCFFIQFVVHVSLSSLLFGSNDCRGRVLSDCIVLFQYFVAFSF